MAARKTFQTTIGIGGEISPTLAAAAASASKTLGKLADKSARLDNKLMDLREKHALEAQHLRDTHAQKEIEYSQKLLSQKRMTEEKYALKLRQFRDRQALEDTQLLRDQAVEVEAIEREKARVIAETEQNLAAEIAAQRAKEAEKQARLAKASLAERQDMLRKYGDRMSKFGDGVLKTVTLPMLSLAALGVKTYMEFDDSMRQVQATLQASDSDMVQLTEAARQMGRDTRYSASEAAQAILSIGQAGNDTAQTLALLPTVLNTAQASGLSIDSVAEYMSQTVSILGVGQDYIDDWADQVNKTAAAATVNQQQIFDAVTGAGDVGKMLKGGTVELLTMVGMLGQAGVQGAEAGTTIRALINKLSTASERSDAAQVLSDLNVQITDSEGNLLEMNEIFGQFQQALQGMGNQQQVALMSKIFGEEYGSQALGLISKAGLSWETMSQQINASQGVTEQMAQTMEGGLGGSMRSLQSAGEDVLITIGEKLAPTMQYWSGVLTECANWMSGLDEGTWSLLGNLGALATALGVGSKAVGGLLRLSASLTGLCGSKNGGGMLGAAKAASALWAVLKAPVGAAAPYLALAAGIAAVGAAIDAAHRASIAAELGSRFGELSLSEGEINALTASVTTAFVSAADELNAQWEALNTTAAALSATDMDLSVKLMATVSAPTLSQDDIASLQAAYTDYADSVYNALGAKSGVVQLTLQQAFGTDSETGRDWAGFASEYYSGLQSEVQKYAALIDQEFQQALAGGEIDYEAVAEYQQKISELYRQIEEQQRSADMYTFAEKIKSGMLSYGSTQELYAALKEQLDADKSALDEMYMNLIGETRATGEAEGKTPAEIEAAVDELYSQRDDAYARSTAQYAKIMAETVGKAVDTAMPALGKLDAAAGGFDYLGWMAQYQDLRAKIDENLNWANENPEEYARIMVRLGQGVDQMDALSDELTAIDSDVAMTLFEDLGGQAQLDEYTSSIAALQAAGEQVSPELQEMADMMQTLKLMSAPLALESLFSVGKDLNAIPPEQLAKAQAQLEQAGTDSAQGLADGMTAGAPTVATAGGDMSQAAIDAAQDTLQTHSPSVVMQQMGLYAGQGLALGITASQGVVSAAMSGMLSNVRGYFAPSWSSAWQSVAASMGAALAGMAGYMDSAMSRVISSAQSGLNRLRSLAASAGAISVSTVPKMAQGATLTAPTIVEVAEAGYPETIVPHIDTPRSRALLADAAAGVGVGLGGINITFAPQVVVQGGGDAASQLEQAMGDIEDQFEVWFERFMARNRAVAYGNV